MFTFRQTHCFSLILEQFILKRLTLINQSNRCFFDGDGNFVPYGFQSWVFHQCQNAHYYSNNLGVCLKGLLFLLKKFKIGQCGSHSTPKLCWKISTHLSWKAVRNPCPLCPLQWSQDNPCTQTSYTSYAHTREERMRKETELCCNTGVNGATPCTTIRPTHCRNK